MRLRILLLAALIVSINAYGQDSLTHKLIADSIKPPIDKTLTNLDSGKIEIINSKFDKIDSVNINLHQNLQKAHALLFTGTAFQDSSRTVTNTLEQSIQSKLDSLHRLNPVKRISHQYFSLDTVINNSSLQKLNNTKTKITETKSGLETKINTPANKLNERLSVLNNESHEQGNLSFGTQPTDLPELPSANPISTQIKIEGISPGEKLSMPDLNEKIPDVSNNVSMDKLKSSNIGLDGTTEFTSKVSAYSDETKSIRAGGLNKMDHIDKAIVSNIENGQFNAAQEELLAGKSHLESFEKFRNEEAFKKHALEKGRALVTEQILMHESHIVTVVNKLSRYQKLQGTIFSRVKGLPIRQIKEKKPPVIERLNPALTIQVQNKTHLLLDVNPSVHYRIKSSLSAGAGWNDRIVFSEALTFSRPYRVYGPRFYCEFSVFNGLWLKADLERMRSKLPLASLSQERNRHKWNWNYFAGLKKEFTFSRIVTGNVQFMYAINNVKRNQLYVDRFNVRFGFQFPFKANSDRKAIRE